MLQTHVPERPIEGGVVEPRGGSSVRPWTSFARFATLTTWSSVAGLAIWLGAQTLAGRSTLQAPLPRTGQGDTADWPMHNFDVRNGRYSPLDEVNASNVSRLR